MQPSPEDTHCRDCTFSPEFTPVKPPDTSTGQPGRFFLLAAAFLGVSAPIVRAVRAAFSGARPDPQLFIGPLLVAATCFTLYILWSVIAFFMRKSVIDAHNRKRQEESLEEFWIFRVDGRAHRHTVEPEVKLGVVLRVQRLQPHPVALYTGKEVVRTRWQARLIRCPFRPYSCHMHDFHGREHTHLALAEYDSQSAVLVETIEDALLLVEHAANVEDCIRKTARAEIAERERMSILQHYNDLGEGCAELSFRMTYAKLDSEFKPYDHVVRVRRDMDGLLAGQPPTLYGAWAIKAAERHKGALARIGMGRQVRRTS